MNLKKIPVDHYHDANQYSVAALARPHEKKVTFKNWKKVLPYTIQSPDRHFDARIWGLARKNQVKREEIPR